MFLSKYCLSVVDANARILRASVDGIPMLWNSSLLAMSSSEKTVCGGSGGVYLSNIRCATLSAFVFMFSVNRRWLMSSSPYLRRSLCISSMRLSILSASTPSRRRSAVCSGSTFTHCPLSVSNTSVCSISMYGRPFFSPL